jgi:hypothetical protein
MFIRRFYYLLTWLGCLLIFWAYRQWITWLVLIVVTFFPILSLLISLPAMLSARLHFNLPTITYRGTTCKLQPMCKAIFPAPQWNCIMELSNSLTGHRQQIEVGSLLPTDHCGLLTIRIRDAYVSDYLGLFRFRIRRRQYFTLTVRPQPITPDKKAAFQNSADHLVHIGDTPDHTSPRAYRPGDNTRQIHWKLSQKTGTLIINEAAQKSNPLLLRIKLQGTDAELDQKLETLLCLGELLTDQNITFIIECISSEGIEQWYIQDKDCMTQTIDTILCRGRCSLLPMDPTNEIGSCSYEIGG